ncbi:hypothetical protein STRIP9103_08003 [Streptomyces ipomoeae 91-03]|uniref:Uncharacterized protein n=1 Tax=Streptomyces ipomoeae 91-03 TaxID=698759 RepID=L1L073_9ACTN|nr:hypothetical protein STRIP9103_08003 [Streptomyces ipomoeae 91-03]
MRHATSGTSASVLLRTGGRVFTQVPGIARGRNRPRKCGDAACRTAHSGITKFPPHRAARGVVHYLWA